MDKFLKDPNASLDFMIDWFKWLAGDTIVASEWDSPDGISIDSHTHIASQTIVWVSGGEDGTSYVLTNRITTAAGRIDERSITINVVNR